MESKSLNSCTTALTVLSIYSQLFKATLQYRHGTMQSLLITNTGLHDIPTHEVAQGTYSARKHRKVNLKKGTVLTHLAWVWEAT